MIEVTVTKHSVSVTGHAGYDEPGRDIICSAVSVLTQNLIHSLCDLTGGTVSFRIEPGNTILEYEDLSEQGKLLIDSFFIGICRIQDVYGSEYVQIK